jgi:exopolysaccharide production protein ExoY
LPAWKRALDFAMLLGLSPFLGVVMLAIALLIKCSSRGPILFRQERIGLYGARFVCFKFRTMYVAAETRSHESHLHSLIESSVPMQKLDDNDARIIRCGQLLRASGLDELPQIFNVLRGEMSLIGPRPCIPYEFEKYRTQDSRRFDAVPGITGLWQVSGKNSTTFRQMIDLDVAYVTRLTLRQDLGIVFRTLPVLIKQTLQLVRRKLRKAGLRDQLVDCTTKEVLPL